MNVRGFGPVCAGLAALAALPAAPAAETSHPCAQVRDDTDRLACYDAAFGKPARPATATSAGDSPRPPAATPPSAPPAAGRPTAAPTAAKPERAVAKSDAPVQTTATFTAAVTAFSRLNNGRFVVTLENGQVWQQIEPDAVAEVAVGDKVTLRPAMLGSWMLVTRAGVKTRVTRVK